MTTVKKPFISIVVPSHNEQDNVAVLFRSVKKQLKLYRFEIIFVDDGSTDNTLKNLVELAAKNKEVKYISFSRNFGHQAALRAGLRAAKGDAVISMDADMQHPPELLPTLVSKWQKDGFEVVYTIRKDTSDTSLKRRLASSMFYSILNFLSGLKMEDGAADFRLLDRRVVDVINAQQESDIFLRGYINWIGFKQMGIPYEPAKRFSGTSKYTLGRLISFAAKGVTQFSLKPLRLAYLLASAAFGLALIYLVYAAVTTFTGHAVSGWLSIITLVVFLQGVQFLLLGLLGEYLGRTFMQTKHRPEFIISTTNISSKVHE